jgi:hypothetical protein
MKTDDEMALGVDIISDDTELTDQIADDISTLSPKEQRALQALLTSMTSEEAAKAAKMSSVTLWRIKRDPKFRVIYDKVRRELARHAMDAMPRQVPNAVQTIVDIVTDKSTPTATRFAAAKFMVSFAKETIGVEDVKERLSELEFFIKYKMAKGK